MIKGTADWSGCPPGLSADPVAQDPSILGTFLYLLGDMLPLGHMLPCSEG